MGGCAGLPSGRKSCPPSRSISANTASISRASRSTGSSSTPRPKRRTRTSVPENRYSFGRRTAWLRPCRKIFALSLTGSTLWHLPQVDTTDAALMASTAGISPGALMISRSAYSSHARNGPGEMVVKMVTGPACPAHGPECVRRVGASRCRTCAKPQSKGAPILSRCRFKSKNERWPCHPILRIFSSLARRRPSGDRLQERRALQGRLGAGTSRSGRAVARRLARCDWSGRCS